jgi:hypothetical protein
VDPLSGAVLVEVLIVVAGVVIVIFVAVSLYNAWKAKVAAASLLPCALLPDALFPDICTGTCPTGGCVATATRRYLIFFKQAAVCGCRTPGAIPPGGTPPGITPPGGIPPSGPTAGSDGIAPVTGGTHH